MKRYTKKYSKIPTGHPWLDTWIGLNRHIKTADLETCEHLLTIERQNRRRRSFLNRIVGRKIKLIAIREFSSVGVEGGEND